MNPDFVQLRYDRVMSDGLPGSPGDGNDIRMMSFVAENDIPFGRVISVGSQCFNPTTAILGGGTIAATAGFLQGHANETDLAEWSAIKDGCLTVKIDGTDKALTGLDFSAVKTLSEVAEVVNSALGDSATCVYLNDADCFVITSASTGATSAVTEPRDGETGTGLLAHLGFDGTPVTKVGMAGHSAIVLGVSVRSMTAEALPGKNSDTTVVKIGDVGAYTNDGVIKVQAMESVKFNGDVYFDNQTGCIYGSAASGRTKLGTSKFRADAAQGQIVLIDVTGLR